MTPPGFGHHRRALLQRGLALAALGLLAGCGVVSLPGQRPAAPRRVGFLEAGANPLLEAFREAMRDLGYVEGQSLLIEYRSADLDLDRLPALALELVDQHVEVLIAREGGSARALKDASSTIPIVLAGGGDPVEQGLVANLAHPEGNVTGVGTNYVGTMGKWLELLKETVPTIARPAAVYDAHTAILPATQKALADAAETLQLQLAWYDVHELDGLAGLLATARANVAVPESVLLRANEVIQ